MITDGKATSMAMLGGTQNDKLIESQAAVDPWLVYKVKIMI